MIPIAMVSDCRNMNAIGRSLIALILYWNAANGLLALQPFCEINNIKWRGLGHWYP